MGKGLVYQAGITAGTEVVALADLNVFHATACAEIIGSGGTPLFAL